MKEVFYHNDACRKAMADRYLELLMLQRTGKYYPAIGFADLFEQSQGWTPLDILQPLWPANSIEDITSSFGDFITYNSTRGLQLHDKVLLAFLYEQVAYGGRRASDRCLMDNVNDDGYQWLKELCDSLCNRLGCDMFALERGVADYMLWRYMYLQNDLMAPLTDGHKKRDNMEDDLVKLVKYRLRAESTDAEPWDERKLLRLHGLNTWRVPAAPLPWPMFYLMNQRVEGIITELQYQMTVAYYDTADPRGECMQRMSQGCQVDYGQLLDEGGVKKMATNMGETPQRALLIFAKGMERTKEFFTTFAQAGEATYDFFCQTDHWGAFGQKLQRRYALTLGDVREAICEEGVDLDAIPTMRWLSQLWSSGVALVCASIKPREETAAAAAAELPAVAGKAKRKSVAAMPAPQGIAAEAVEPAGAPDADAMVQNEEGEWDAEQEEENRAQQEATLLAEACKQRETQQTAAEEASLQMRPYLIDRRLNCAFNFTLFLANAEKIVRTKTAGRSRDERDFVENCCSRYWHGEPMLQLLPFVARAVNVLLQDYLHERLEEHPITEAESDGYMPLTHLSHTRLLRLTPASVHRVDSNTRKERIYQVLKAHDGALSTDEILKILNEKYVDEQISSACLKTYMSEDKRFVCTNRRSSVYELRERNDIPFTSIRDAMVHFLEQYDRPMPLDDITQFVLQYYPHTEKRNLRINMEMSKRFSSYMGCLFGLANKDYDEALLKANHIYAMGATSKAAQAYRHEVYCKIMAAAHKAKAEKKERTRKIAESKHSNKASKAKGKTK